MQSETLNQVLSRLGYTTSNGATQYAKLIWRDGKLAFSGTADDVWRWLRETEQVK